jgi:hypothetical protein
MGLLLYLGILLLLLLSRKEGLIERLYTGSNSDVPHEWMGFYGSTAF